MCKTHEEIEELKREWCADPIWDIESTGGFEAHYEELREFSKQQHLRWQEEYASVLMTKAQALGVPGNTKLASYILGLERKLEEMNRVLENVYFR